MEMVKDTPNGQRLPELADKDDADNDVDDESPWQIYLP